MTSPKSSVASFVNMATLKALILWHEQQRTQQNPKFVEIKHSGDVNGKVMEGLQSMLGQL